MPAPTSASFGACSKMRTRRPRFRRHAAAASPPRPAPAIRPLVGTNAGCLHRVAPDGRLAPHERREFRRRIAERLDADLTQPLGGCPLLDYLLPLPPPGR